MHNSLGISPAVMVLEPEPALLNQIFTSGNYGRVEQPFHYFMFNTKWLTANVTSIFIECITIEMILVWKCADKHIPHTTVHHDG